VFIEAEANYGPAPKTMEEAISLMNEWRNKYFSVSEKYQALLEEKLVPRHTEES